MTADRHPSRQATAAAEAREGLIDLLVGHVDRAYVTAGQEGALQTVRELFEQMELPALTALVHELGLAAEPVREAEPGERRE